MENAVLDQQPPPVPGTPQNAATFNKFDTYPWAQDRQFLQGLAAMLGPLSPQLAPNGSSQQSLGIALQARIWWYHSLQGIAIDLQAYEAYHRGHGGGGPVAPRPDAAIVARLEDIQRRMAAMAGAEAGEEGLAAPGPPAWQNGGQISKVDLSKKADDGAGSHGGGAAGGGGGSGGGADAPYPAHFQAIIEAVTLGKPVPGVKDIPNTVVRQPGISPIGKMQAPRKPWETRPEGASGGEDAEGPRQEESFLDSEFPPVDEGEAAHTGIA